MAIIDVLKYEGPNNELVWKWSPENGNSKRSNQLSIELKEELTQKLQEFASTTDNLEEIFENREQIEISRFYERLPKPVAMAMQELLEDKIYARTPEVPEAEK